jgi:histidyl-tRNA synthetase
VKLWYSGSFYRYERPQAGRYRHFSQVGAEALGTEDPAVDAELVIIAVDAYRELGLTRFRTLINSLGCRECRPAYRALLQDFLRGLDLDEDTRRRVEINPLRVLDDKRPEVRAQLADVPLAADHLCAGCKAHHDEVRRLLTDAEVDFTDDPHLVRGLDYYTRTTFEFVHDLLGAQSSIGGGGRYDGLAESIGGAPLAGVGWALGVDRTVLAIEAEGIELATPPTCQVFAVPLGERAKEALFTTVTELRRAGIAADLAYGGKGLKGAMKSAGRSGAAFAIIVGDRDLDEGPDGTAQLKDLNTGDQTAVAIPDLVSTIQGRLQ